MTRQRQSYAQFLAIVAPCAAKPRSIALEPHCVRAAASTEAANREHQIGGTLSCNTRSPSARDLSPRLAVAGHALAQPAPPPVYPGTVYPGAGLPPHEIVTIVRSTGLEPMGSPVRQGPTYALRAVDPAGEEVRVIVDAQRGRIVKVIPLMAPRYAMPLLRPPYGRPPRPMAMVPEGYGPNPRAPMLPPGTEGPPPPNAAGPGGYRAGLLALRARARRPIRRSRRDHRRCRDHGPNSRPPIHPMPSRAWRPPPPPSVKVGQRARNHRQRHHAGPSGRRGAGRGA